jgi:glycopeptide antibiotics resistance protein
MIDLEVLINRWAARVAIVSPLLILMGTLAPFDFSLESQFSIAEIIDYFFRYYGKLDDWSANIILYLPLGFGLASLLGGKPSQRAQFVTILLCAILSLTTELLQLFLPSRHPSFSDIFANSLGGLLGFHVFFRWKYPIFIFVLTLVERVKGWISVKNLSVVLVGYVALVFLGSLHLQARMDLSNWSTIYPLMLGNEQTEAGALPWQGRISEVAIADRAIAEPEVAQAFSQGSLFKVAEDSLAATYQLADQGADRAGYFDLTQQLPKLVWKGDLADFNQETPNLLEPGRWLETEQPASLLTQRLRKTSQFTLSVKVAPSSTTQTGPAQIVSFSGSLDSRNFSLGQQESNLIFRLRTPATGGSGIRPEVFIPNVFENTDSHHIVVIYSKSTLRFYIDNLQNVYSFDLNPGIVLFQNLLPLNRLSNLGIVICEFLYYGLIFIPLGSLIGFAVITMTETRARPLPWVLLILIGIFIVPLLIEVLFTISDSRDLSLENLLLSIILATSTLIAIAVDKSQGVH